MLLQVGEIFAYECGLPIIVINYDNLMEMEIIDAALKLVCSIVSVAS